MLKNHPHTLHIIFGIAPVTQRIQISQIQFVLISLGYTCGSQSNLACYKVFTTTFALMVEQDAVHGKHTVTFTIILGNPETILLGHPIRRTGIERSRFLLRDFLHQSEQLGGRCLINLGLFSRPRIRTASNIRSVPTASASAVYSGTSKLTFTWL